MSSSRYKDAASQHAVSCAASMTRSSSLSTSRSAESATPISVNRVRSASADCAIFRCSAASERVANSSQAVFKIRICESRSLGRGNSTSRVISLRAMRTTLGSAFFISSRKGSLASCSSNTTAAGWKSITDSALSQIFVGNAVSSSSAARATQSASEPRAIRTLSAT